MENLSVGGTFYFDVIRNGEVVDSFEAKNMVVNQGLARMLDLVFAPDSSPSANFSACYISLFEGNVTPFHTTTAATYPALHTECTAYSELTRPEYVGVRTDLVVTNNDAKAEFTMTATKTIYGAAIHAGSDVKGGTGGTLMAVARFGSGAKTLQADDILRARYDFTAQNT